jgi:hypothetical protein
VTLDQLNDAFLANADDMHNTMQLLRVQRSKVDQRSASSNLLTRSALQGGHSLTSKRSAGAEALKSMEQEERDREELIETQRRLIKQMERQLDLQERMEQLGFKFESGSGSRNTVEMISEARKLEASSEKLLVGAKRNNDKLRRLLDENDKP